MAFVASVMVGCQEETKPANDPTTIAPASSTVEPMTTIAPPAETASPVDAGSPPPPPPPNLVKPYGAPPADGLLT